jgi:hypothetical protein
MRFFWGGLWNASPALPVYVVGGIAFRTKQDFGPLSDPRFIRTETIMSNAKHIYSIADNHARTVQVCIDRLHELGANEQLQSLTGRLQKLAVRAKSGDDEIGT